MSNTVAMSPREKTTSVFGDRIINLTGNDVCGDEEGDPGDDDEEAGGQVVVDDVVRDVADEHHLEAGQAVIAEGAAHEDLVLLLQALDRDVVVEHDGPGFAVKRWGKARVVA